MWRTSLADLRYRKRRFIIAVLATSIAFGLSLLMSGTMTHLERESDRVVALFDADRFVVADGDTGPFTTTRLLPVTVAEQLREQPGVERADPFIQARDTLKDRDVNVLGLEVGGLGWPEPRSGRLPTGPGEVVVDRGLGYDVGDHITLGDLDLEVSGESSGTTYYFGMPAVFATISDVQQGFLYGQPMATAVAVAGEDVPTLPGTRVMDGDEVVRDLNRPQESGAQTVRIINLLLWAMAAGVVASMVYLSVLEGGRDIAVAKAVGTTSGSLFAGLAVQGLALAVLACLGGALVCLALSPVMPMAVETTWRAYVGILAVGIVVGLLAALVGLRRAARVDPALAFGR
jgi:putative ABC transport system permease protein